MSKLLLKTIISISIFLFGFHLNAQMSADKIIGLDYVSFEKSMREVAKDFRYGFKNIMGDTISEEPLVFSTRLNFSSALKTFFFNDEKLGNIFCAVFSDPISKEEAENLYGELITGLSKCSFKQFYVESHTEVKKNKVIYSEFVPERNAPKSHPIYNNFVMQVRMMSPPNSDKWKVTVIAFFMREVPED
jgi:hypothetical protein